MLVGNQFRRFMLKEYPNWLLLLSEKQRYLGRCYAWWRDQSTGQSEGLRLSQISTEAREELFTTIFEDVIKGCKALGYSTDDYGGEFLLNTAYLANEEGHNHHLHVHFIPRTRRSFSVESHPELTAHDPQWGRNYPSPHERILDMNQMLSIQQIMTHALA